jgi:glycosyltransferase involved in cell wall biosynthesis
MRVCIGSAGRFHAFDLAQQMDRLGHLTRLYTAYPRWKTDGLPRKKVRTFPWLAVPSAALARVLNTRGWREIDWMVIDTFGSWLARRLEPCDVLHCLSCYGSRAHRIAKERYGALTVCDRGSSHILFQDEILAEEHSRWKVPYRHFDPRMVERELQEYEECDLILVPSDFAYQSFVEKGVAREKLRLDPLGVDLSVFRPVPKRDKTFRLIFAGWASLQKGIPYLLQAVEPLRLPDFELWLLGGVDPELKPILERYRDSFRFLGFIPRTELFSYYSQGSVFVIASVQEGLALVQAQAMACGLPVIATPNTGAASLFTDGREGFIVPIRDPAAIREKILYLYEHPDVRDAMSQAARERVQRLGGWNEYGNHTLSIYQGALARRFGGPGAAGAGQSPAR